MDVRNRRLALSLVVIAALLLVLIPQTGAASTRDDYVVPIALETLTMRGIAVYRVHNPAGLSVDGVMRHSSDAYTSFAPRHIAFIDPQGGVTTLRESHWAYFKPGGRSSLAPEGTVYAGGPDSTTKTEQTEDWKFTQGDHFAANFGVTAGWFVFSWAFFDDYFHAALFANWTAGTTVELLYAGTDIVAASDMDLRGGARAGISPAARANIVDRIETVGEQIFALATWERPGAGGVGEIALGDSTMSHTYPLTSTHEEDVRDEIGWDLERRFGIDWEEFAPIVGENQTWFSVGEVETIVGVPLREEAENRTGAPLVYDGRGCTVCPEDNHVVFTGSRSAWLNLTYAGYARQMRAGLLFATLPAGTLPNGVFHHDCWISMPNFQRMECDPPGLI